jgi:hypothetical protein
MNFKRPCWKTLFIALALIPLGYAGAKLTPAVFHFFHIHYNKLGPQDLITLMFALIAGVGFYVAIIAAIWCLFIAVFLIPRSEKMKKILYGRN